MIDIKQAAPSPWTEIMRNVYSQFGEDGILEEIFRRIGTTNKQCFEVGAADGKWFSNSRRLIDEGWSAALIEADERNWPELDKLDDPPRVNVVHGRVEATGPQSLDAILDMCKFDERPDLGVIDIDGQEYYVWNGLLKYRPRVIVVEYDPDAKAEFIPDLGGAGQASFAAICSVSVSKGYFNAAVTQTNAIFVHNSEKEKLFANMAGDKVLPTETAAPPVLATGKEQEIKIAAILSRPRFGLNVFWDCASEALAPWHIPIQSFYGVFWGACMQTAMEDNLGDGVDWILTLDYDSLFTSKHVQQLIDALAQNPEIDAIAALQPRRGRPLPLMVRPDGTAPMTGGPIQCTTAHFGLTIFRTEKLKQVKKPWFWGKPTPAGDWREGRLDDDIYFWGQWRDAGNTLYVHTGCRIGHVEEMAADYDETYKVRHRYLSEWRKDNGHTIKSFE
jgi:hypothetical protein